MQLSRDTIQRMIGGTSISGGSSGGGGGVSPYILPLASDTVRGGLQIGYAQSGKNYPVQLDGEKAYVNVPWTDHYSWADITDKPATATRWPAWSEVTDKPSTFAPSSGSSYYLTRDAWWTNGETHDANDLRSGVVFAYSTQSNVPVTGTLVAFSCRTNNNYALQLQGAYNLDTLYFRNRNGDGNTWRSWHYVIHDGNIGNQSVNYATSAGSATSATKDGDGNTISSTYLKLAGGTMTGSIIPNTDNAIDLGSSTKRWRYIYSYGIWGKSGAALRLGGNDATLMYLTSDAKCGIGTDSPSQKLHVSGGLLAITNNSRTVTIGAQNNGAIHIYNDNNSGTYFNGVVSSNGNGAYDLGTSTYPWKKLYAQGCEIYAKSPSVHVGTSSLARISLHWSSDSNRGIYDYSGYWVVATNGTNTFMMKGNVGIGTTSPSYKLHVSGQIYCTGGFTFLSDSRKKNIIDHDVQLSVDDIANAPLIHYTLKDDPEKRVRVGSIAQYWKKVLPESVNHAEDGTLSMNYDLQAHASVIVLARKVRELEQIIYNLQSRIA